MRHETDTDIIPDHFDGWANSEPFAFEKVCDALGLDPEYIRQGSYRWRRTCRDGLAPPSLPRFVSRRVSPRLRVRPRRAA